MINYKLTKKQIIILISIIFFIVVIGVVIPFFGFIQNRNKNIPMFCSDQTRMLMPNNYRYISYLDFDIKSSGEIIVKARTFYNFSLQTIKFDSSDQCK